MVDEFINELSTTSTLEIGDILIAETDPGGTPETKGILWNDLQNLIMDFQVYQIVPSVSSNNLTVAIKDLAGNDATAHKVVRFKIGNTIYSLAEAASIVKNAGTNWCNLGSAELAAKATDLFVYAIGETGASAGLKFGFSRIPYARTMSDFVNTSTSEKYIAGNWTNFTSTDAVSNIGRFRAQLSASASYNWSIASQVIVNRPIYETDWLSWTPVATGLTVGSGTYSCSYKIVEQLLYYSFAFTLSGSTVSSPVTFSMPVTPSAAGNMQCTLVDAGTASYWGSADLSSNVRYVRVTNAAGTYITASTEISSTVPHVWANTDIISFRGWDRLI